MTRNEFLKAFIAGNRRKQSAQAIYRNMSVELNSKPAPTVRIELAEKDFEIVASLGQLETALLNGFTIHENPGENQAR